MSDVDRFAMERRILNHPGATVGSLTRLAADLHQLLEQREEECAAIRGLISETNARLAEVQKERPRGQRMSSPGR